MKTANQYLDKHKEKITETLATTNNILFQAISRGQTNYDPSYCQNKDVLYNIFKNVKASIQVASFLKQVPDFVNLSSPETKERNIFVSQGRVEAAFFGYEGQELNNKNFSKNYIDSASKDLKKVHFRMNLGRATYKDGQMILPADYKKVPVEQVFIRFFPTSSWVTKVKQCLALKILYRRKVISKLFSLKEVFPFEDFKEIVNNNKLNKSKFYKKELKVYDQYLKLRYQVLINALEDQIDQIVNRIELYTVIVGGRTKSTLTSSSYETSSTEEYSSEDKATAKNTAQSNQPNQLDKDSLTQQNEQLVASFTEALSQVQLGGVIDSNTANNIISFLKLNQSSSLNNNLVNSDQGNSGQGDLDQDFLDNLQDYPNQDSQVNQDQANQVNQDEDNQDNEEYDPLLDSYLNFNVVRQKVYSYGLTFVVSETLDKLGITNFLRECFYNNEKCVELVKDHVTKLLHTSLASRISLTCNPLAVYRLAHYQDFSRRYWHAAKMFRKVNVNITNIHQELSTALLKRDLRRAKKITLFLDSTLIRSASDNLLKTSLTYSKLDNFVKAFKYSLLQTESGIPYIYDVGDGSVKDVKDLSGLLLNLKDRGVDLSKLEICADAGYFSEENQVYAQALGIKYYFMAKSKVKIIKEQITKQTFLDRALKFNKKYLINVLSDVISFKDYIDPKKPYVAEICKELPDFSIEGIADKKILLTHIYNSQKCFNEFLTFSEELTSYYDSVVGLDHEIEPLQGYSRKIANLFYFKDGEYHFNREKGHDELLSLGVSTIVSNDLSDLSGNKVVEVYKKRMKIEASFKFIKSFKGILPHYARKNETSEYKCFLTWLLTVVLGHLKTQFYADRKAKLSSSKATNVDECFLEDSQKEFNQALVEIHNRLLVSIDINDPRSVTYSKSNSKKLKDALAGLNLKDPITYNYAQGFVQHSSNYKS